MVEFYKENIVNLVETNENSKDLVNIKTLLLKDIMRSKKVTKINFLQLKILDKLKKISSDLQLTLVNKSFEKEIKNFYY